MFFKGKVSLVIIDDICPACLSTSHLFYASKRVSNLMWSLSHSEVLYDLKHIGQTWRQRLLLDYQIYL
jgi:hypothetical protein